MRHYRIVFQGGGVRIVNLLGAAAKLAERQKLGQLNVSRLAGTSAGAIVASLYAVAPDTALRAYNDLVGTTSNIPSRLQSAFKKPGVFGTIRILLGRPLWRISH